MQIEELLPEYYRCRFPAGLWCRWLAAGCNPRPLQNREISLTLAHDVYVRYLCVRRAADLKALLAKKCPRKIDVGAVYEAEPSALKNRTNVVSRELVFDVDLTDYDDVRTCCREAGICAKCWKLMVVACEVLDRALREDFGFTSLLWVYSGRRGIHCWVSCAEARTLSSKARSAVADYLAVVTGGDSKAKKVVLDTDNVHSSIKRAVEIIKEHFEQILVDQQFISTSEGVAKFLKLIPDESLASRVRESFESSPPDSLLRWKSFVQTYDIFWREHNNDRRIRHLIEEIQLQWCYPRLDINVSKGLNHLLKAPFSIHPKTGRVCVAFKVEDASRLDVTAVPELCDLIDEQSPKHAKAKQAMQEAVAIFQSHVWSLEKEESSRKRTAAESNIDF